MDRTWWTFVLVPRSHTALRPHAVRRDRRSGPSALACGDPHGGRSLAECGDVALARMGMPGSTCWSSGVMKLRTRAEEDAPVPHLRDFLSRFRPAGAPGAGRAAVPADRSRDLESELSAVFVLLDGPSADCAGIVGAARRDAGQITASARAEASRIMAAAQRQAATRTARLVEEAIFAARAESAAITAAGAAEAAATSERARERLPVLAERAVALVRALTEPESPA